MKKHLLLLPLVMTLPVLSLAQTSSVAAETSEVIEPIPAVKKTIMKSARSTKFNKGLYFDQLDNGVVLSPMELEYDLTVDKGATLRMGNVSINERTFFFSLLPLGKTHPQLSNVLKPEEASEQVLVMKWPEKLIQTGTLEVISKTGKVLWSYDIEATEREAWKKKLTSWKNQLVKQGVEAKALGNSGIFGTQLALSNLDEKKAPFRGLRESFRFCLTQNVGKSSSKLCSIWYGARTTATGVIIGKVRSDAAQPRVLLQSETAPLKDSKVIAADMPVSFYADLSSNQSYEFISQPVRMQLMDIADTVKPGVLRVVGYDVRPTNPSVILNPDQYTSLTKAIGFEDTIGDFRKFWMSILKVDNPALYFPGDGGGVFKQKFQLSEVPRNTSRPYLSTQTPTGTYVDGARLQGRKLPDAQLASDETRVQVSEQDPTRFEWTFKAAQKGEINKSYLNVEYGGKSYRSFYELYRGYPIELSGRFTGIAAGGSMLLLGEVAYNHWFEDLFGWDDYYLSRLRWGVSAKYFQAFTKLKVDDAGTTAALNVMTLDAKYRVTPGLWGREETVGGMLSYQSIQYSTITAPMVGVGAFWARSMPRVFDDIFNIVPLMRYPKFVDMEFIFYPMSLNSSVTLNANFALNFHGKVLWTKNIFGEAGFGLKRFAFKDSTSNQQAELNTFYGTMGLGVNF